MIVVAPNWPKMHWFWDLVNLSTKPPLQLPHWPHLLKQPFNQKYHSLSRWQRELRHLKVPHLENYMSQGGQFLVPTESCG